MVMPTRWALGLLSLSRPFVPRRPTMRDRTPRSATARPLRVPAARQGVALDPFDDVDDLEQQASCRGVGLDQLEPQPVAQPVGLAGAFADQDLAGLGLAGEPLAGRGERE